MKGLICKNFVKSLRRISHRAISTTERAAGGWSPPVQGGPLVRGANLLGGESVKVVLLTKMMLVWDEASPPERILISHVKIFSRV